MALADGNVGTGECGDLYPGEQFSPVTQPVEVPNCHSSASGGGWGYHPETDAADQHPGVAGLPADQGFCLADASRLAVVGDRHRLLLRARVRQTG